MCEHFVRKLFIAVVTGGKHILLVTDIHMLGPRSPGEQSSALSVSTCAGNGRGRAGWLLTRVLGENITDELYGGSCL